MTENFCTVEVGEESVSFVAVKQETGIGFQSQLYQQLGLDGNFDEEEEENVFVPLHDPLALEDEDALLINYDPNLEIDRRITRTNEPTIATASSEPLESTEQLAMVKLEETFPNQQPDSILPTSSTYDVCQPTKKTYLCTECGIRFPSDIMFQYHRNKFHGQNLKHKCKKCGKKFKEKTQLKVHETIHDPNRWKGEPKYSCEFCGKAYHLKVSLDGHRKEKHLGYVKPKQRSTKLVRQHHAKGIRNPAPEPKPDKKLHPCPYCDLVFKYNHEVRKHRIVHFDEKLFKCKICEQPCATASSLRTHMKAIHLKPKPTTGSRPSRPRFMANQPCPCLICNRVFKQPSQLRNHMTLHTRETPVECDLCDQKFRVKYELNKHKLKFHSPNDFRNRLKYKCMICGTDQFSTVGRLHAHRRRKHPLIPYNSEIERAFACGICGKPYFLKEQAMVCAILRHDPTSLLKQMFKIKCPACPEERFWHHSLIAIRKHWEEEHSSKVLPANLRQGMYQTPPPQDVLPNVVINKVMKNDILENGCKVKHEYPLFVQLDLMDVPESLKQRPKNLREGVLSQCTICGKVMSSPYSLKTHMALHRKGRIFPKIECPTCGKGFRKVTTFRLHEKIHKTDSSKPRKRGRPPKRNPTVASHAIIKQKRNHEEINLIQKPEPIEFQFQNLPINSNNRWNDCIRVSCNDASAVAKILENKTVRVDMTRCDAAEQHLVRIDHHEIDDVFQNTVSVNLNDEGAVQTVLDHKSPIIVLFRC